MVDGFDACHIVAYPDTGLLSGGGDPEYGCAGPEKPGSNGVSLCVGDITVNVDILMVIAQSD
jgi:hypothetical protein